MAQDAETKESWKTKAAPELRVDMGLAASYSQDEFSQICKGFIPREMEDKWFIYFEDDWLNVHRSWTGFQIYGIEFAQNGDEFSIINSWVNRDDSQYTETDLEYDQAIALFLIDALLLNKDVPFPTKGLEDSGEDALAAWSTFGSAIL